MNLPAFTRQMKKAQYSNKRHLNEYSLSLRCDFYLLLLLLTYFTAPRYNNLSLSWFKRNEYLPLPSQPKLVLIYRLQRDGRLSWPWKFVAHLFTRRGTASGIAMAFSLWLQRLTRRIVCLCASLLLYESVVSSTAVISNINTHSTDMLYSRPH